MYIYVRMLILTKKIPKQLSERGGKSQYVNAIRILSTISKQSLEGFKCGLLLFDQKNSFSITEY